MNPRRSLTILAACAALVAGCGGDDEQSAQAEDGREPVKIVASTTQVADFAREVGGEDAEVTGILSANTDPHDYEPRPDDVAAVAEADVVLTSGDHIDEWMEEIVESAGTDAPVIEVGEGRPVELEGGEHEDEEHEGEEEHSEGEEHEGEEADPHWWHDPTNAMYATERIAEALAEANPEAEAGFSDRADAYVARLEALDETIAGCLDAIPAGKRKIVTDHDALAYFANRYDIEVVGTVLPSTTTQAQPSAGDIDELSDTVKREGVGAVFPQSSLSARLVEAIADQTGAAVGDPLYADTLGPEGSSGATYVDSVASNADSVTRGLTGGERSCDAAA